MQGSMAPAGSSTSSRFFLLWLVMVVSWTATLQLPAMTTAQRPDPVTYTIRAENVLIHSDYFEMNMRPWAEQNLPIVSNFIRNRILCRQTREHTEVILQFEDTLPPPTDRAYALGNTIMMSVGFIAASPLFNDDAERVDYFQRTVYHEMTHVWQFLTGYSRNQDETRGLVEGMADYAAAKGHGDDFLTCQPTVGDVWYQGYCHTAKFLMYAEKVGHGGIVCNANIMMKNGYDELTFRTILRNTPPESVWRDYLNSLASPPPPYYQKKNPPPPPRLVVDGRRNNNRVADDVLVAATATY